MSTPSSTSSPPSTGRLLDQPRALWATAFAATVGFMGIGLVDPILTSIAQGLSATPSQVSLLFTSYFFVTAIMMLVTGMVSSRWGGRAALLAGALLIAIFAALSGTSQTVAQLVGYRAGWGLGNALFVATGLSVIVSVTRGGMATAVLLYEAALGLGLSIGPLLGAALGAHSWRYPFFGTATLMLIGFVAIAMFLPKLPKPTRRITLSDPLRALAHPGLATAAMAGLCYFYGFFTVLAFAPFVLDLSSHAVGLIFFGWGVLLALFSVVVAPRLQARMSSFSLLAATLIVFAVILLAMGWSSSKMVVAGAVILSGACMGIASAIFTEMALDVSDAPRPVASAGYNFVRWFAGVIAPYASALVGEHLGVAATFTMTAVIVLIAVAILMLRRATLGRFAQVQGTTPASADVSPATSSSAPSAAQPCVVVAVDGSDHDATLLARAAAVAGGHPLVVIHVREAQAIAADTGTVDGREDPVLVSALGQLSTLGVAARAQSLEASPSRVPQVIAGLAHALKAELLVLGTRHQGDLGDLLHGSVAIEMVRRPPCALLFVPSQAAVDLTTNPS